MHHVSVRACPAALLPGCRYLSPGLRLLAFPLPARSMSVVHPNCLTTFKLSVIRLLRGEGLLESEQQQEEQEEEAAVHDGSAAVCSSNEGGGRRALRSLLSGAEAEEVEDMYAPLLPGLYETWILMEVIGGWVGRVGTLQSRGQCRVGVPGWRMQACMRS